MFESTGSPYSELALLYPDAHTELNFSSPLELLVATILSAQTTDKRVNLVTPVLFARYRTAADYAAADRAEMEKIIQSTGFFRAKTSSLIGLGQALCDLFAGEVPGKLADLVTLRGVGRKTANVVLGNAFGVPGITVDTHFSRLARRFGWTAQTDPVKIEQEVGSLFPKSRRARPAASGSLVPVAVSHSSRFPTATVACGSASRVQRRASSRDGQRVGR